MTSKLYLCGITCGSEIEKIKTLINSTKDCVDGFCWTVDSKPLFDWFSDKNKDEKLATQTWDLTQFLIQNKKSGEIVQHPWQNAHDWQANEWLHCGVLKEGDWVWMFDSSESPTDFWIENIKQHIKILEEKGARALYYSGRPYLFKWDEYLFLHGTPHWGLFGLTGGVLTQQEETKSRYIVNKRDLNPAKHYQEHDTKYYLYGRSNIIDAFYGKYGQNVVNYHEQKRREFREYLRDFTGLEPNLHSLYVFFKNKDVNPWTDYEIEMMELEFCLSEYYRRTVLGEDFMKDIVPLREKWSFKNYLEFGSGFSDTNYLGTRLKYDLQLNKK